MTQRTPTPASDADAAARAADRDRRRHGAPDGEGDHREHHDETAGEVERADQREWLQAWRLEAVEQVADLEGPPLSKRAAPEHQSAGVNRHDHAPEHPGERDHREARRPSAGTGW